MVQQVWLHIGAPKSGTSSLQKYLSANVAGLKSQGLAYLSPPNRAGANDLAIAWNRSRSGELAALAAPINTAIKTAPEELALLSSEMFFGFSPKDIFQIFPPLRDRPLNVLIYLRRQDRYIESAYLQKSKNGRFRGSLADYIAKFDGSGSDYAAMIAPWQNLGQRVRLVPRVIEPGRLAGGDVVADCMAQIGLAAPGPRAPAAVNVSPGLHRVQLLQAAQLAGLVSPRRLQRVMAQQFPQDPADRAPLMTQAERRAFLQRYSAGNEAIRARYFPHDAQLFRTEDLAADDAETGIAPFSDAQLAEITRMLQVIKRLL